MSFSKYFLMIFMILITIYSASSISETVDFETGGLEGFVSVAGPCTVDTTSKIEGSNSLNVDNFGAVNDDCQKTINISNGNTHLSTIVLYSSTNNFHSVGFYGDSNVLARCMTYTGTKIWCYKNSTASWADTGFVYSANTPYNFTFIINNITKTWDFYINGTLELSGLDYERNQDVKQFRMTGSTGTSYYDEVYINIGEPHYFDITAKDGGNLSTILSFNATINGVNYETNNGTIHTNLQNGLYHINLSSPIYNERWYYNHNTGYDLQAELFTGETIDVVFKNNTGYPLTEGKIYRTNNNEILQFQGNISYYLNDLRSELVTIYIGNLSTDTYFQQYQFENNFSPSINETINIINYTDGEFRIRVTDETRANLPYATVRVYSDDPYNDTINTVNNLFIGQYITDNEGKTDWIKINSKSILEVDVTKEGYTLQRDRSIVAIDYNNSEFEIILTDSNIVDLGFSKILIEKRFYNRSEAIYGSIYYPGSSTVNIQTDWRELYNNSIKEELSELNPLSFYLNLLNPSIYTTSTERDVWPFILNPGEHFNSSTDATDNINLTIYVDGTYKGFVEIVFIGEDDYVEVISPLDFDDIGRGTLLIFILLCGIFTGFIFRSMGAGEIGLLAGTFIASLIDPIYFIVITVFAIRWVIKIFNKVRKDE